MDRKIKFICIGIYLFHFSITQFILPWQKTVNFFPFYDWNLFSNTYAESYWPLIRILEVNHQKLDPPVLTIHNNYIKRAKSYWRIPEQTKRLITLIKMKGEEDLEVLNAREELEANLFAPYDQVRYEAIWGLVNGRENLFTENIKDIAGSWTFEYKRNK